MSRTEIQQLHERIRPLAKKEAKPQYTYWQIKLTDCTITAYTSGKVVFQGKDLSWLEDAPEEQKKSPAAGKNLAGAYPMAGSDEVGTGDYFGPVVVAACLIPDPETARKLIAMGITDSKAMTDARIRETAPEIARLCPHSICIMDNTKYNEVYERLKNINAIKCMLHNQVYLNLKAKGNELPETCIIDQFCPPKRYFELLSGTEDVVRNIHFETKAESKYPAVAAASVLARNAFLRSLDAMDEKYEFHFEKGGGDRADRCGLQFLEEHPLSDLKDTAKLHFANTDKIIGRWNRKHPNEPYKNPRKQETLF